MDQLTPAQMRWAVVIIRTCRRSPLLHDDDHRARAADISLEVALAESSLTMYANGNNSTSLTLPHEAIGWDHGSVGLFQQQVGGAPNSTADWGTTRQCMNAAWSTARFLQDLCRQDWRTRSNWQLAQTVQHSADSSGGNYRRWDDLAIATRKRLWRSAR